MDDAVHIVEDQAGEVVAFARRPFMPTPASGRRRRIIPVLRSEASKAGGTSNDLVNARIMRETAQSIANPGDSGAHDAEAASDAIAMLKEIARATSARP